MPALSRIAPAAVRTILRAVTAPDATVTAPLARPARRRERALASAAHRGFQISVLISFAFLLGLLTLDAHTAWLASVKLALGTTMMGEGLLLATNWRAARRLTLWRLRRSRAGAHTSARAQLTWRLASPALQLLGLIWLAAGLLAALLGLQGLV